MSTESVVTTNLGNRKHCEFCGKAEARTIESYNGEFCYVCDYCYHLLGLNKKNAILKCARCGEINILSRPDVITAYYDMDDCIGDSEINYNVKIGHEYLVLCNECAKDLKEFWKKGKKLPQC